MRQLAAGMLVPETAVNKDNLPTPGERNIGAARRSLPLKPEPIAQPMQQTPDDEFRLGVRALDPRHVQAALLLREMIRHWREHVP